MRGDISGQGSSTLTFDSNLALTDDARAGLLTTRCDQPGIIHASSNRYGGFANGTTSCDAGGFEMPWATVDASDNVTLPCSGLACNRFVLPPGDRDGGLRVTAAGCDLDLTVPFAASVPSDGAGGPRRDAGTTAGAFERICP